MAQDSKSLVVTEYENPNDFKSNFQYTKELASLSDTKRAELLNLTKSIVPTDLSTIRNYGSEYIGVLDAGSKTLLDSATNNLGDEIGTHIVELRSALDMIDFKDLDPNNSSFFKRLIKRIPGVNKLVMNASKAMSKYNSIRENVDDIVKNIVGLKQISYQDNAAIETMFETTKDTVKHLRESIMGLNLLISNVEKEIAEKSNDLEAHELISMTAYRDSLKRREANLLVYENMLSYSLVEMRITQVNNNIMIEQADDMVETVIPSWKLNLATLVAANNGKKFAAALGVVTETGNAFAKAISDAVHTNSKEVAEQSGKLLCSLETLEYTHNKLAETLRDVEKIKADNLANIEKVEQYLLNKGDNTRLLNQI